jgi:orotate phosphoribosyltransferase-like protein
LAKALYDLKDSGDSVITLEQLAVPFSRHIAEHLMCDKQIYSPRRYEGHEEK